MAHKKDNRLSRITSMQEVKKSIHASTKVLNPSKQFIEKLACEMDLIEMKCRSGWRVQEIADLLQKDTSDFIRIFRQLNGITPKKFIDEKRKEKLIELINNSNHYGYTIGKELGFNNEKSFYIWVKRQYGKTFKELAHQYRNQRIKETIHSSIKHLEMLPRIVDQK